VPAATALRTKAEEAGRRAQPAVGRQVPHLAQADETHRLDVARLGRGPPAGVVDEAHDAPVGDGGAQAGQPAFVAGGAQGVELHLPPPAVERLVGLRRQHGDQLLQGGAGRAPQLGVDAALHHLRPEREQRGLGGREGQRREEVARQ
jgi:hypothetical protein